MNLDLAANKLTIEDNTVEVNVPNNTKAQLMYYLNCVSEVLETDKLGRYINYKEYYLIPDSEIVSIFYLAVLFNPEVMMKSGLFLLRNNSFDYLRNRFLKITDETVGIHANEEIIIGGLVVRAIQIMTCTESWLSDYYYSPIKRVINMLSEPPPPPPVSPRVGSRIHHDCGCTCNIF